MKKVQLDLVDSLFVSESARKITKEPDWWKKLSTNQQKKYLEKHKTSQLAKYLREKEAQKKRLAKKKAERANKAVDVEPEELDQDIAELEVPEPEVDLVPPLTPVDPAKKKESIFSRLRKAVAPILKRKKRSPEELAVAIERVTRDEIDRRANDKFPQVRSTIAEQTSKFSNKVKSVASAISDQLSPAKKKELGSYLKAKSKGMSTKNDSKGEQVARDVGFGLAEVALGLGALVAVFSGAAVIAGALTAAYLGFRDYKSTIPRSRKKDIPVPQQEQENPAEVEQNSTETKAQESTDTSNQQETVPSETKVEEVKTEPVKEKDDLDFEDDDSELDRMLENAHKSLEEEEPASEKAPEELESKSSDAEIEDDPVEFLTADFAVWLQDQDLDLIARKISEYIAIEEMKAEGWQPKLSDLSDDELDAVLSPRQEIEELVSNSSDDSDEDYEQLYVEVSDDKPKKLTLRCDKECAKLPVDQRWRYNLRFGNRIIGNIRCVDKTTGGKFSRKWICVLEDGFDESVYRSGRPIKNDQPYTLIKRGKIYLVQPIKQTFDECYAWAKLNIDKEFL